MKIRGATVEVKCACGTVFTARVADRKRGWAKLCSKSCAATRTNRKTGNFQRFVELRDAAIRSEDDGDYSYGASRFEDDYDDHDCNKD